MQTNATRSMHKVLEECDDYYCMLVGNNPEEKLLTRQTSLLLLFPASQRVKAVSAIS